MTEWFEHFQFVRDPYNIIDPRKIDDAFLTWDRPDLQSVRASVDSFETDVVKQRRVGLKIFGPIGGGKTWLARLIEKELHEKAGSLPFIYTKIPRMEPTFQVVFRLAMQSFMEKPLAQIVNQRDGEDLKRTETWTQLFENEDLAAALFDWHQKRDIIARQWLFGDKLSANDLRNIGAASSLDSDYDRFEVLRTVIETTSRHLGNVVLIVDELDNASPKLAGQLGDGLRDLLDEFSEGFALICAYTGQRLEEWYDFGYSENLLARLIYTAELSALNPDGIDEFLRAHHGKYRAEAVKVTDQLYPFESGAAGSLLGLMAPTKRYPRYFLTNCQMLGRRAYEEKKKITPDLVKEMSDYLPSRT